MVSLTVVVNSVEMSGCLSQSLFPYCCVATCNAPFSCLYGTCEAVEQLGGKALNSFNFLCFIKTVRSCIISCLAFGFEN